jgi:hypothetical protein
MHLVFAREVAASFGRYQRKDWGELPPDDKDFNDQAIGAGECIIAAYQTSRGRIWIITEWDRSATTILFPNEY